MFTESLPQVIKCFKFADVFKDSPFEWDHEGSPGRLKFKSNYRRLKKIGSIILQIHLICSFIVFTQFFISVIQAKGYYLNTSTLIMLIALVVYFLGHINLREYLRHDQDIHLLVNGLLQFDSSYNRGKIPRPFWVYFRNQSLLNKLNTLFGIGVLVTSYVFPAPYIFGLHFHNPCKPSLLGYWILADCNGNGDNQSWVLSKVVLLFTNYVVWAYIFKVSPLLFAFFQSGAMIALRENLDLFWKYYQNNLIPHEEVVLMQRKLQILNRLANHITKDRLRVAYMAIIITTQCLFTTSIVKAAVKISSSGSDILSQDMLVLMLATIGVIDTTLAIMVCFTVMGTVYKDSKDLLGKIKCHHSNQANRLIRWRNMKFLKSCELIKVQFGSNNFVDEKTPLTCLDFANSMTVSLLLLEQ